MKQAFQKAAHIAVDDLDLTYEELKQLQHSLIEVFKYHLDLTYEELKLLKQKQGIRAGQDLDLTYEELKHNSFSSSRQKYVSFRSYLWGIETINEI